MPKISKERLEARRRGIVLAAARCFVRNGIQSTGMRDIFRAANLSPGAVYRYFASKEELVAAVAAGGPSAVEAAIEAARPAGGTAARPGDLFAAAAAERPAARLVGELETAALGSPRVAAALAERRRATRRQLAAALGRPDDALAELALGLCEGLARRRALTPEADLAPLAEAAADLLSPRL